MYKPYHQVCATIRVCVYVCVCVYLCVCACMCVCVCVCVCLYASVYMCDTQTSQQTTDEITHLLGGSPLHIRAAIVVKSLATPAMWYLVRLSGAILAMNTN